MFEEMSVPRTPWELTKYYQVAKPPVVIS